MVGVHLVVVTLHVRLTTMVMKTCTGQEFVGMKQYDWLQNGFFTNWGTIAKTFPVENFKHGCQHDNIFFLWELFGGQVCGATSNPRTRNLTSKELQLEAFKK